MKSLRRMLLPPVLSLMIVLHVPLAVLASEGDATAVTEPTSTQTSEEVSPQPSETVEQPSTTTTTEEVTAPTPPPPPPPPPPPATGPAQPTGADAGKYVFNPETGKWESDKYIWDPATGQTQPKYDPGYYYNPETGRWDTTQYEYHPESGSYEPVTVSAATPLTVATGSPQTGGLSEPSLAKSLAALLGLPDPSNSNTGPNSTNSASLSNNSTGLFDLFSRAVVNNTVNSSATSGDASVEGNTLGGDATSGPATVLANLLNLLNSAWSWASGGLTYFAKNIYGDHFGDININPATSASTTGGGCIGLCGGAGSGLVMNSNTGPNSTNTATSSNSTDLTVNYTAEGEINNDLNLLAQSGNASVTGNTAGGNATSGDALVELNILNMINSMIGAGQTFFGLVNVFGDLNGDILFPTGFLDSATGSATCSLCSNGGGSISNANTGPNSTNTAGVTNSTDVDVNNSSLAGFNNDINTVAQTGDALVDHNTSAGNASSGDATTRNNLFNMANTSLFGDNAILVLVNVMGRWVGGIMNIGSVGGSNSALLTGNAVIGNNDTGPDSVNTATANTDTDVELNNNTTGRINNNVQAGAVSGNATVADNTRGGNAASGDASVVSSVANIFNSSLNLSKWFGVLVVNVFGDWKGSVNEDTEAGENAPIPVQPLGSAVGGAQSGGTTRKSSNPNARVAAVSGGGVVASSGESQVAVDDDKASTKVASAKRIVQGQAKSQSRTGLLLILMAASLLLASALFGIDKKLKNRH